MEHIKTCTVIYNPVASRFDNVLLSQVVQMLKARDIRVTVIKSNKMGHVVPLVMKYNLLCDLILTMGGDGTVGEAYQGFFYSQTQHALYAHLPTGTTNDLAKNFRLDQNDPLKTLEDVLDGQVESMDIFSVNNDPFAYISAFGYMANVPYATPASWKRNLGYNGYVAYAMKELAKGPRKIHATYTRNGEVREETVLLALISNATSFAGVDIYKKEDIDLDDGIFEVIFLKYLTPKLVKDIMRDYLKNDLDFSRYGDCIDIFTSDDMTLSFNNKKLKLDICNDGDRYPTEKSDNVTLHYQAAGKLRLLLPKQAEEGAIDEEQ